MNKPNLEKLLEQARLAQDTQIAEFDSQPLQQQILAQLGAEPAAAELKVNAPQPTADKPTWLTWTWLTNPWWVSTAAMVPLVVGFTLGSLDPLTGLEQLGDTSTTLDLLAVAEPAWQDLIGDSNE